MNDAARIIDEIKIKLQDLEALLDSDEPESEIDLEPPEPGKPKKIYQMFPSNDSPEDLEDIADAAMEKVEDDDEPDAEKDEDEDEELDSNALDDIDDDVDEEEEVEEEDSEMAVALLKCLETASRFHGMSPDEVAKKTGFIKYRVVKELKQLCANNKIERLGLRPTTYRSIIKDSSTT